MIHPTAFIAPGATVLGDVTLGQDSSIWYHAVIRADMAPITIGDETNIQDLCVVHVDKDVPCTIGRRVGVGHRVILHGCTVEDECLIGMGSILLNGVCVGTGSLVGAGAVLIEGMEVPPSSLVLGIPARVVRSVDAELSGRIQSNWRDYVALAKRHRAGQVSRHVPHATTDL